MNQKIGVILFVALSCIGCGGAKYMKVVPSETDAQIFIDNQLKGTGQASVPIEENASVSVIVKKPGFLDWGPFSFENLPNRPFLNRIEAKLEKDESLDASAVSDIANKGFSQVVNKKLDEDKAWKILGSIITSYFDELVISDKSTSYLKTAWVPQPFNKGQMMIRTRVIVKGVSGDQLTYQIKIVSERALALHGEKLLVNNDEIFQPWDRILKKYNDLVSEFQTRLK